MTLESAAKELLESTKCACKKTKCATKMCMCFSGGFSCGDLCNCTDCENEEETTVERELNNDASDTDESDEDL